MMLPIVFCVGPCRGGDPQKHDSPLPAGAEDTFGIDPNQAACVMEGDRVSRLQLGTPLGFGLKLKAASQSEMLASCTEAASVSCPCQGAWAHARHLQIPWPRHGLHMHRRVRSAQDGNHGTAPFNRGSAAQPRHRPFSRRDDIRAKASRAVEDCFCTVGFQDLTNQDFQKRIATANLTIGLAESPEHGRAQVKTPHLPHRHGRRLARQ